ncbi:MAG: hypothetical protein ABEJ84_01920 [Halodesulfurarchaeum sp.]
MSTQSDTAKEESDRSLEDLCRSIEENDAFSEDVRLLASGLLEAIENGDIDVS